MRLNNHLSNFYNNFPALATALMGLLIILCATIPFYIVNGGFFIVGDCHTQYIPFFIESRRMIESGGLWWSWNSGFGSNFIGAYSYYTLFNPFSLLILLWPAQYIADAMYWVLLLKFAVGAYIAFHYLRLFVDDRLATLGSILYIFSSYTLSIIAYYNFIDAMVLFPLILIAIERHMTKGRRDSGFIAFAFFINAISHYYLFVGSLIGTIIYCIVRMFSHEWRGVKVPKYIYTITMAVLGTAMASFVFLPSIFSIQGGLREFNPIASGVTTIFIRLLSLFYPFDAIDSSLIPWSGFADPSCYLPVVSVTLALAYIITKPRSWVSVLLIILTLCISTPYLSGLFNLYSQARYSRWVYLPALMFSLASVLYIKEHGRHTRLLTTIIIVASCSAIMLIMYCYKNELFPTAVQEWCCRIIKDANYPTHEMRGRNIIVITFVSQALSLLYFFNKNVRLRHLLAMIALCIIMVWGNFGYQYCASEIYVPTPPRSEQVSHTMTHRYKLTSNDLLNAGLYYSVPSIRHYHSILNHNHKELYSLDTKMIFAEINNTGEAFYTFASAQYDYNTQDSTITALPYYIPMGYTYDSYITLSEAQAWVGKNMNSDVYHLMLATLIVEDSDTTHLPATLAHYSIPDTLPHIATLAQERRETTCTSFNGTSGGFTADITLPQEDVVFFSIPCDKGFNITVNGVEVTPLKVNAGFMGIPCTAGHNRIEATYRTPWLKEGIVLSVAALISILLILLLSHRRQ